MGKTYVRLSISTQLFSIATISSIGTFNHYVTTAHEPSWLKSIVNFNFQKVIFGEFRGLAHPDYVKKLSLKQLLISKKTSALVQAIQNIWFWRVHLGRFRRGGTLKLCRNFCLLNVFWYQYKLKPDLKPFNKLIIQSCFFKQFHCLILKDFYNYERNRSQGPHTMVFEKHQHSCFGIHSGFKVLFGINFSEHFLKVWNPFSS